MRVSASGGVRLHLTPMVASINSISQGGESYEW
nr:MAG TPA: hypothetical protein [Caudoviricetes sp.]